MPPRNADDPRLAFAVLRFELRRRHKEREGMLANDGREASLTVRSGHVGSRPIRGAEGPQRADMGVKSAHCGSALPAPVLS